MFYFGHAHYNHKPRPQNSYMSMWYGEGEGGSNKGLEARLYSQGLFSSVSVMIIGKCRGVTINFLRSDKDYGHNLSIPPPHGDRVKPICILGETILKSCLPISSFHSFFYPSTKFYKTCGQVDKMGKF